MIFFSKLINFIYEQLIKQFFEFLDIFVAGEVVNVNDVELQC